MKSADLFTEHTRFGCGVQKNPNRETDEFMLAGLRNEVRNRDDWLLYVDDIDIVLTRHRPSTRVGSTDVLIHQINWNLEKNTGLTTGISVTGMLNPLSNVLIPGLFSELQDTVFPQWHP